MNAINNSNYKNTTPPCIPKKSAHHAHRADAVDCDAGDDDGPPCPVLHTCSCWTDAANVEQSTPSRSFLQIFPKSLFMMSKLATPTSERRIAPSKFTSHHLFHINPHCKQKRKQRKCGRRRENDSSGQSPSKRLFEERPALTGHNSLTDNIERWRKKNNAFFAEGGGSRRRMGANWDSHTLNVFT